MKRLVIAICLLASAASAEAGIVQLRTNPFSNYPSPLSAIDPGDVLQNVPVYVSDTAPYSGFFVETARVQATVALAESLTARFGRTLAATAEGAVEVTQSDPDQWAEVVERVIKDDESQPAGLAALEDQKRRMEALIPLLASAAEEVPGLVEQIPTLTESASHDFSGLSGKIKMVRHMNALRASSMQLKNAGTGAVRALNNLRRIVSMVHP